MLKNLARKIIGIGTLALIVSVATVSASPTTKTQKMVERYPTLASSALTHANLSDLAEGQLLQSDSLVINASDLEKYMEDLPQHIEEQMRNNLFFLLEQMAAQELLLLEASGKDAAESQTTDDPDTRINQHLESRFGAIEASDQEVTAFYEANKNMFGGASLDQIKDELQQYVSSQKQQEAVNEHLRTIGQRREIALSAEWVKRQADLARNNPVDKARASGRPSLVDFGSVGCGPCDMMAPILETLAAKYDGTMNVEFIPVNEHQILAARYGVQSIPVQILFDKKGKEVWRHTGYISQADLEAQIAELGLE